MCEEQPSISSGKQPQHLTVSLSSRIATGGSLLRHLKGVLVEPTLQGGAVKGDLAPGELWVTTKPTKSSQIPRKRSSRGSSLSQRVCVLFIQAMKGYLFQPAREILGYVMLGMKRMRHFFFFFLFPGEKSCAIVQKQPQVSTITPAPRSFSITRSTVRALGSGVRVRVKVRRGQRRTGGPRTNPIYDCPLPHQSSSGPWELLATHLHPSFHNNHGPIIRKHFFLTFSHSNETLERIFVYGSAIQSQLEVQLRIITGT